MDNDQELDLTFTIPTNYTESALVLGTFEMRNFVEAIILGGAIGFAEVKLINCDTTLKIVIVLISCIPIMLLAAFGIDGDSLTQYIGRIFRYWKNKRKMSLRREPEDTK